MKKLLTMMALFGAASLFGETVTWTGGAGTSDYATAGNWDLNKVPAESDSVVIGGADVTVNGNYRIPLSLTLLNGASWTIGGEIQFGNKGIEHLVISGGTVSGGLVASQYQTASLTISDTALVDSATGNNGFWQNTGSYLNFVEGENRSATFTYQTSIAANPFYFFSNPANTPYIRFNDQVINEATFNTQFEYTDNGDGTTTLRFKNIDGWVLSDFSAGEVVDGQVSVSLTAKRYSGGEATVYFVRGLRDYGETFADWPTATEGVALSATDTVAANLTMETGFNYIRAFLLCNGEYQTVAAVRRRVLAPWGDYGELTDVYEYFGEDDKLASAGNWVKNGAVAETAPEAGTDIRWFGRNATYSGRLSIMDKDYFDGATLMLSGDTTVASDVVFSNSTVSIYTLVPAQPLVISLYGTDFATTRDDQWLGVFPPATYRDAAEKRFVNFLAGKKSTFTFQGQNLGITDAASVKEQLVAPGYLTQDGLPISDSDWSAYYTVKVSGTAIQVSFDPEVHANHISDVSYSDATKTSVTLKATIPSLAEGAQVIVAYGMESITAENIVAKGEVVSVTDDLVVKALTGLTSDQIYSYAFAIVNEDKVESFLSGEFYTQDYDYVYKNGAWVIGRVPGSLGAGIKALFQDDFTTVWEPVPSGKKLDGVVVTGSTILYGNGVAMELCNASYVNTRTTSLANDVSYGLYQCPLAFDLTSTSGNGIIRRGSSYTCYATEEQCGSVFENLVPKFRLNGAEIPEELFRANFTTNSIATDKTTSNTVTTVNMPLSQLTMTYWEPFPASSADSDWTVQAGARVKLASSIKAKSVTIADASDVRIDLNGKNLSVSALSVGGERLKGTFTSADCSWLVGDGAVTCRTGFILTIR